jgi:DNA-nicking Smr family endonuclease
MVKRRSIFDAAAAEARARSERSRDARSDGDSPADDGALIFRAAVRDVKPLAQTALAEGSMKPRKHSRIAAGPAQREPAEMPLLADRVPPEDSLSAADALAFRRPGVRARVMRSLRRGLYPIEDELDLHGWSQAAARDRLAEFIAANRDAGHRCVRIVHGKGYRSGARGPILKMAVNAWLKRHGDVMAFTSARSIDGGTGALYVLLRA